MDFLFIADPLESFKIKKDSTLAMMRVAQEAGHHLWFCQSRNLLWRDDFVVADIKRAKEFYQADFVIVFPHWGWEHEKAASAEQHRVAHLMIDSGADIVVGGHPHVTQNIETYKNKYIFIASVILFLTALRE